MSAAFDINIPKSPEAWKQRHSKRAVCVGVLPSATRDRLQDGVVVLAPAKFTREMHCTFRQTGGCQEARTKTVHTSTQLNPPGGEQGLSTSPKQTTSHVHVQQRCRCPYQQTHWAAPDVWHVSHPSADAMHVPG